jgi:hypothetical protein
MGEPVGVKFCSHERGPDQKGPTDGNEANPQVAFFKRSYLIVSFGHVVTQMTKAMLYFGGTLKHMWTWSAIRCPSNSSKPFWQHNSPSILPTPCRNVPYNRFWRYFGTITTTWNLQSHLTCDKLCQSCIGSSSSSPPGAFPKEEPILFHPGSVEPLQVLH